MHLTSAELSFLGSCLTALVAIIAVIANQMATRKALKHQREMAEDERLWQRRADLYVELLETTAAWTRGETEAEPSMQSIQARLIAFGSSDVISVALRWIDLAKLGPTDPNALEAEFEISTTVQDELKGYQPERRIYRLKRRFQTIRRRRMVHPEER